MNKALFLIASLFLILAGVIWIKEESPQEPEAELILSHVSTQAPTVGISQIAVTLPSAQSQTLAAKKEEFRAFLRSTLNELPRESTIGAHEDQHHRSQALSNAVVPLGKLARLLTENSDYVADGLKFYQACAKKTDILIAIRAVCLRNWLDWSRKTGAKLEDISAQLPHDIKHIAKELALSE